MDATVDCGQSSRADRERLYAWLWDGRETASKETFIRTRDDDAAWRRAHPIERAAQEALARAREWTAIHWDRANARRLTDAADNLRRLSDILGELVDDVVVLRRAWQATRAFRAVRRRAELECQLCRRPVAVSFLGRPECAELDHLEELDGSPLREIATFTIPAIVDAAWQRDAGYLSQDAAAARAWEILAFAPGYPHPIPGATA